MSENQSTQEKAEKVTKTSTGDTALNIKQQAKSKTTRAAIKYALIANLILAAFSVSEILLFKLAVWFAETAFGIDDAGTDHIYKVVYISAFLGFMTYHIYIQVQRESIAKTFFRKHGFNKQRLWQGIGLGVILSFIAIGLIAIKDGAVLRSASQAFTLTVVITSGYVGFFFSRFTTYFFIKGLKTMLNIPSNK